MSFTVFDIIIWVLFPNPHKLCQKWLADQQAGRMILALILPNPSLELVMSRKFDR